MQRSRKTVIIVTAVLAAAGIVSAVTGTAMKKRVSRAEYKDAGRICTAIRSTMVTTLLSRSR